MLHHDTGNLKDTFEPNATAKQKPFRVNVLANEVNLTFGASVAPILRPERLMAKSPSLYVPLAVLEQKKHVITIISRL